MAQLESGTPEPEKGEGAPKQRLDPPKAKIQHSAGSGIGAGAKGILTGHKEDSSELYSGGSGHGLLLCHC